MAKKPAFDAVIPGREANPESRDSGSGPSDHPGMTVELPRIAPQTEQFGPGNLYPFVAEVDAVRGAGRCGQAPQFWIDGAAAGAHPSGDRIERRRLLCRRQGKSAEHHEAKLPVRGQSFDI